MVTGGVSALVTDASSKASMVVLDPSPSEHEVKAASVVAYLQSRDEITEFWTKGSASGKTELLVDHAVRAAVLVRTVLADAVKEGLELKAGSLAESSNGVPKGGKNAGGDAVMTG